jgi:hypothetical protein
MRDAQPTSPGRKRVDYEFARCVVFVNASQLLMFTVCEGNQAVDVSFL